jgi:hypothetical protein
LQIGSTWKRWRLFNISQSSYSAELKNSHGENGT